MADSAAFLPSFTPSSLLNTLSPSHPRLKLAPTRRARCVAERQLSHRRSTIYPCATASEDEPAPLDGSQDAEPEQGAQSVSDQDITYAESEPTQLRWSEIPFASIHEELDAIDDYEQQEELEEKDPWPKFLRGAAYEYWGQPKLALAQYRLTAPAAGLRQIPELWERRAYNAFKMGEVIAASAYFDVANLLLDEASGNELHFMHWFYDNFQDYVPKRNGPPASLQQAVCKYCVGEFERAKEGLVAQLADTNYTLEHAILWMFAVAYRSSETGDVSDADYRMLRSSLQEDYEWQPRLAMLITLFGAAAQKKDEDAKAAEKSILKAVESDAEVDILTHTYLALYHDAFTGDTDRRDEELDRLNGIESAPETNNVENFIFHTAKNRFTVPPTATMREIPESRT